MTRTNKGIVRGIQLGLAFLFLPALVSAEQALLVYPSSPSVFKFDPNRYQTVSSTHPNYDPAYAIGGEMLWDTIDGRVPIEVYRAPVLVGFEPSSTGANEFQTLYNNFTVIVDGFGEYPRTFSNLYIHFLPTPYSSTPQIYMDAQLVKQAACEIQSLSVSTPVGDGYYADTVEQQVLWSGSQGLRIIAFNDKNFNGVFDGGVPRWSIRALDTTIPVTSHSWGAIKSLYSE